MISGRSRDALIGVGAIVVIAALVALSIAVYDHVFTSRLGVTAQVSSAGDSLQQGSDVEVRGIVVGEVSKVTTDGENGASVHLLLDPSQAKTLPENLTVQLLPETLFGQRYVNLLIPSAPAGTLGAGDTLHEDTSPYTVQMEKLFVDLEHAFTAVQPQKLAATLGEVALLLRNRGNSLGETLGTVGTYLDKLTPKVPQITDDLARFSEVARNYSSAAPQLLDGLAAFTTTSQTLASQRVDYANLLAGLTRTGQSYGAFVGGSRSQIIGLSADSRPSLKITADYASEFPCVTQALVQLIPRVNKAFGAGTRNPGARANLKVVGQQNPYTTPTKYGHYSGPHCPDVPTTALGGTALADTQGIPGANTVTTRIAANVAGMGVANSPQENRLIAELMAPKIDVAPAAYPSWGSLVVGPALRGTTVDAP